MRVGIDGRAMSCPQVGGYKSYTTNLVKCLAEFDETNTYVIYLDRKVPEETLPGKQNCQFQVLQTPIPGRWWREQVMLPYRLVQNNMTVGHFPCNTGPTLCGAPYVVTIHDVIRFMDVPQIPRPYASSTALEMVSLLYIRFSTAQAARRAKIVITDSECSKRDIVSYLGIPADKIRVVYQAAKGLYRPVEDTEAVNACLSRYQLREDYILALGSTAPRKNSTTVMRAFAHLNRELDVRCRLVFCCDSQAAVELGKLARRLGIERRVSLLAGVSDSDLALLYNAAELFVYPSLYEGFGLPALEAMACGTPVVTSNCSSLPEVTGEAAMLVDPTDEIALSRAIDRLLGDDHLREQLKQKGLERASLFSGRRQAKEMTSAYRDAAAS